MRSVPWKLVLLAAAATLASCGGPASPAAPLPTPLPPTPSPTATPSLLRPLPISGDYRLSITLGPGCDRVLQRYQHREWDVVVKTEGDHSQIDFVGPGRIFPDRTAIPCAVCGDIGVPPARPAVYTTFKFQEDTGDYAIAYDLRSMDAAVLGDTVAGRAQGFFSQVHISAARVDCSANFHDFALTPR